MKIILVAFVVLFPFILLIGCDGKHASSTKSPMDAKALDALDTVILPLVMKTQGDSIMSSDKVLFTDIGVEVKRGGEKPEQSSAEAKLYDFAEMIAGIVKEGDFDEYKDLSVCALNISTENRPLVEACTVENEEFRAHFNAMAEGKFELTSRGFFRVGNLFHFVSVSTETGVERRTLFPIVYLDKQCLANAQIPPNDVTSLALGSLAQSLWHSFPKPKSSEADDYRCQLAVPIPDSTSEYLRLLFDMYTVDEESNFRGVFDAYVKAVGLLANARKGGESGEVALRQFAELCSPGAQEDLANVFRRALGPNDTTAAQGSDSPGLQQAGWEAQILQLQSRLPRYPLAVVDVGVELCVVLAAESNALDAPIVSCRVAGGKESPRLTDLFAQDGWSRFIEKLEVQESLRALILGLS
jgi:hypothetical protein